MTKKQITSCQLVSLADVLAMKECAERVNIEANEKQKQLVARAES